MKLEINVPVSGLDLASLLESEQVLFLCQKQRTNHSSKGWSLDSFWANADREAHPGTNAIGFRAGALVRHEDQ